MKVLVIGLDGASMDLIKQWAQEGKLPTFAKLMREGSYGYLESVIPTLTVPAWNCLATGKNPGKIGCFGFVQKAYGTYDFRFPSSLVKKANNIWDILSDHGKKVFVFNAPNIQYAYKINGYMVAGPLCISEERLTYPASLRKDLDKINYEGDINDLYELNRLNDCELSERLKEITEKHFNALFHFLDKKWDFGFIVFSELDRVQHRFWERKKILLSHYQNIDRKLKVLLDKLERENGETTVIIVSDHGFGDNKRIFFINEWLSKRKLLEVRKTSVVKLITVLSSILRKFNLFRIVISVMKLPILKPLYLYTSQQTEKVDVVWNKTKAFSYGTWGSIYINLSGREPQGVVKEEEYEQLRSEIIERLKEISVKAHRREEIYSGEYLKLAPDIIVETDDYVNSISSRVFYGKEFREGVGGNHRRINGTFIARGPHIKENFEIKAKIYDIAPTILHIFGIPIPKDMDGRVLKEIFKGDLATREIEYQELEEKKILTKRIRELKRLRRI